MFKKIVIIVLLILVGTASVVLLIKSVGKNREDLTPPPSVENQLTPTSIQFVSPDGETVDINGVKMRNFYKSVLSQNNEKDALIADEQEYQITYLAQFNKFIVSVLGSPFETSRQKAESNFLTVLKVSKEDACRLPVEVNTPRFANPDESGTNYPLSFCQR